MAEAYMYGHAVSVLMLRCRNATEHPQDKVSMYLGDKLCPSAHCLFAGILAGLKQLQRRLRTTRRIAHQDSTPTSNAISSASFTDEE